MHECSVAMPSLSAPPLAPPPSHSSEHSTVGQLAALVAAACGLLPCWYQQSPPHLEQTEVLRGMCQCSQQPSQLMSTPFPPCSHHWHSQNSKSRPHSQLEAANPALQAPLQTIYPQHHLLNPAPQTLCISAQWCDANSAALPDGLHVLLGSKPKQCPHVAPSHLLETRCMLHCCIQAPTNVPPPGLPQPKCPFLRQATETPTDKICRTVPPPANWTTQAHFWYWVSSTLAIATAHSKRPKFTSGSTSSSAPRTPIQATLPGCRCIRNACFASDSHISSGSVLAQFWR
jgi:hypothetical protein